MKLYQHVKTHPLPEGLSEMDLVAKQKEVSSVFMHYIAGTGLFLEWRENREMFEGTHVCPWSVVSVRLTP